MSDDPETVPVEGWWWCRAHNHIVSNGTTNGCDLATLYYAPTDPDADLVEAMAEACGSSRCARASLDVVKERGECFDPDHGHIDAW